MSTIRWEIVVLTVTLMLSTFMLGKAWQRHHTAPLAQANQQAQGTVDLIDGRWYIIKRDDGLWGIAVWHAATGWNVTGYADADPEKLVETRDWFNNYHDPKVTGVYQ